MGNFYIPPARPDELYHYGVLGMKWGHRRGGANYIYRSHATKKYERKMLRAAKRGNELKRRVYENRFKNASAMDRKEQAYANRVKTGGNIATRILTGGRVGSKGYQMHLAMNKNQGFGGKVAAAAANTFLGGRLIGGNIRKAAHIRRGQHAVKKQYRAERKAAKAAAKNN